MAAHAFFCFRNPPYAAAHPGFDERPSPEEIEAFGSAGAELRAEDRRRRLAALKARIRAALEGTEQVHAEPVPA